MRYFSNLMVKLLALSMIFSVATLPVYGWWWSKQETPSLERIEKQVVIGTSYVFSEQDFYPLEGLTNITIASLPDSEFGALLMGSIPLQANEAVSISAITGLQFEPKNRLGTAKFGLIPTFLDGSTGSPIVVQLDILDRPNEAPLAMDMDLFTYKNIAISCYFDVIDNEGDYLTYQITSPAARGSVTLSEDGSSSFVYQPYENKIGKDEFQYVATDSAGNVSNEGTVRIRIEKAETPVIYGDMEGNSAHKSAISLAESGIFVGECVGNTYLFHPDTPVTRDEFLSLAMAVANLSPLEDVTTTGFFDDGAIPTWSKANVSSALLAGVIQGSYDEMGRPVFQGESVVTLGEASVILDNLLDVAQVSDASQHHWASQAMANLSSVGVSTTSSTPLPAGLTRGEVAELLDGAIALVKEKEDSWLTW